jgi:DNA-binding IscR family transcriptional regulator
MLSKHPKGIALGDIIRVVDGPLAPVRCVSKYFHVSCPREKRCCIRGIMQDVRDVTAKILDNISLADMCDRSRGLSARKERVLRYYV